MRLLCLLFFAFLHMPALALDAGYRIEKAYLTQAQEIVRPDALPQAEFTPYEGDLRLGYAKGSSWIRLTVTPTPAQSAAVSGLAGAPIPLVLRVSPYLLDLVALHQAVDGRWLTQVKGDLYPQKEAYCPDDAHCFVLSGPSDKPQTIFLRLENTGVMFVQTEVLPLDTAVQSLAKRAGQRGVSLAVAVCLLVFGLLYLTIEFSALLVIFCLYQLSVVLFVLAPMGLLSNLLTGWTAASINMASSVLFVSRVALTVVLCWAVVAAYQTSRLYMRLVAVLLLLCAVNFLLLLAGQVRLALQLNFLVFAISPAVHLMGLMSAHEMDKRRRFVLVAWSFIYLLSVTMGTINAWAGMSIAQYTDWLQYFGDWRLNGGVVGLVFFWAVVSEQMARNSAKRQELEDWRLLAEKARGQEEKFKERHALIDMLTHELKTPLGTIKFALATIKRKALTDAEVLQRVHSINASVNRMDDLIEHVARSNKVELVDPSEPSETVAAHELAQDLIGDYDPARFVMSVEKGAVFRADRQMLLVILENLLSNAHKYSAPGHQIRINISVLTTHCSAAPVAGGCPPSAERTTCFEITNHILADAEPDESRLFDRYYRHPSVQDKPGMGIGLSLVQSAARKIGATVAYRHQADQVTFTLRVPL